jgi:hypothetical protein
MTQKQPYMALQPIFMLPTFNCTLSHLRHPHISTLLPLNLDIIAHLLTAKDTAEAFLAYSRIAGLQDAVYGRASANEQSNNSNL